MSAFEVIPSAPRSELSPGYAEKLRDRLAEVLPGLSPADRWRHVRATLDFLTCCTVEGNTMLAPSSAVDVVWHEMIMFTADYRAHCADLGVAFIDHEPTRPGMNTPTVRRTVEALRRNRLLSPETADLWVDDAPAKCCGGCVPL